MNSFKSGAGDLDFGDDENDAADGTASETTANRSTSAGKPGPPSAERPSSAAPDQSASEGRSDERPIADEDPTEHSDPDAGAEEYPYFVRRSNVGDERDTRLEVHVRDKVADREAEFRSALAEHLGTNEVSKTDAREFALLAAFQRPEQVAELMQEEGFGVLD